MEIARVERESSDFQILNQKEIYLKAKIVENNDFW